MVMMMTMIVVMVVLPLSTTVGMGHGDMIMRYFMVALVHFMEVRLVDFLMQVFVAVFMRMQMDVDVRIGSMGMTMGMQEFPDYMPVLLVHVLFGQNIVQQLMSHEREGHLKLVPLEQPSIIEDLMGRPVALDTAVGEQQATIAYLEGDIEIMCTEQQGFIRILEPIDEISTIHRIHVGRRLIEHQDLGLIG